VRIIYEPENQNTIQKTNTTSLVPDDSDEEIEIEEVVETTTQNKPSRDTNTIEIESGDQTVQLPANFFDGISFPKPAGGSMNTKSQAALSNEEKKKSPQKEILKEFWQEINKRSPQTMDDMVKEIPENTPELEPEQMLKLSEALETPNDDINQEYMQRLKEKYLHDKRRPKEIVWNSSNIKEFPKELPKAEVNLDKSKKSDWKKRTIF